MDFYFLNLRTNGITVIYGLFFAPDTTDIGSIVSSEMPYLKEDPLKIEDIGIDYWDMSYASGANLILTDTLPQILGYENGTGERLFTLKSISRDEACAKDAYARILSKIAVTRETKLVPFPIENLEYELKTLDSFVKAKAKSTGTFSESKIQAAYSSKYVDFIGLPMFCVNYGSNP